MHIPTPFKCFDLSSPLPSMIVLNPPVRASSSSSNSSRPRSSHLSERPRFDLDLGAKLKFISRLNFEQKKELSPVDWSKLRLVARMGAACFKNVHNKGLKVEFDSAGQDFFDADTVEAARGGAPEHLVIMVNGMVGSAEDWRYAAEQFVKKLPDKVIVHRSECNSSKSTFDGVDTMGERLAEEAQARGSEDFLCCTLLGGPCCKVCCWETL